MCECIHACVCVHVRMCMCVRVCDCWCRHVCTCACQRPASDIDPRVSFTLSLGTGSLIGSWVSPMRHGYLAHSPRVFSYLRCLRYYKSAQLCSVFHMGAGSQTQVLLHVCQALCGISYRPVPFFLSSFECGCEQWCNYFASRKQSTFTLNSYQVYIRIYTHRRFVNRTQETSEI